MKTLFTPAFPYAPPGANVTALEPGSSRQFAGSLRERVRVEDHAEAVELVLLDQRGVVGLHAQAERGHGKQGVRVTRDGLQPPASQLLRLPLRGDERLAQVAVGRDGDLTEEPLVIEEVPEVRTPCPTVSIIQNRAVAEPPFNRRITGAVVRKSRARSRTPRPRQGRRRASSAGALRMRPRAREVTFDVAEREQRDQRERHRHRQCTGGGREDEIGRERNQPARDVRPGDRGRADERPLRDRVVRVLTRSAS